MLKQPFTKTVPPPSWLSFQHRSVRDLAWALLSPSLFQSIPDFPRKWFQDDYIDNDMASWLARLDANPAPLEQHLSQQRSTRLGIYFEQLLSFYFEHHPRFELLSKNLQVNNQHRTVGEFDFIVYDKQDKVTKHIEVAVKFYLGHQPYLGNIDNNRTFFDWHNWVGPNQKDTLAIKMRHLSEHQLPLANSEYGIKTLEKQAMTNTVSSRLLLRGCFYLPVEKTITLPKFHNPLLPSYYWLSSTQYLQNKNWLNHDNEYIILPRAYWLSPLTVEDLDKKELIIFKTERLREHIDQEAAALINEWQIAEVNRSNQKQLEIKRFFIVNSQNLPSDK